MIDRLKALNGVRSPRLRRMVLYAAVLVALAVGVRIVHNRMTHVEVNDARIAAEMVTLASRAPGWLVARPVKEGDPVRRGQVLGEVDADYARLTEDAQRASLAGAEAEVERLEKLYAETRDATRAALREAQSQVQAADLALEQSRLNASNARGDFLRDRSLVDRNFVSEQRLQHSETAYQVALREQQKTASEAAASRARLAKTEAAARLDSLVAQLQGARANVQALRAKLGLSRLDVHDLSLTSPLNGVVDRTFANAGDYLSAGQRVLMLHDPNLIWVEANIKETDLADISIGSPAQVVVDAYPDRVFDASVSLIGNSATSTFALLPSPNPSGNFTKITQRIPVRLAIQQEGLMLKPGMMVEVSIDIRRR